MAAWARLAGGCHRQQSNLGGRDAPGRKRSACAQRRRRPAFRAFCRTALRSAAAAADPRASINLHQLSARQPAPLLTILKKKLAACLSPLMSSWRTAGGGRGVTCGSCDEKQGERSARGACGRGRARRSAEHVRSGLHGAAASRMWERSEAAAGGNGKSIPGLEIQRHAVGASAGFAAVGADAACWREAATSQLV